MHKHKLQHYCFCKNLTSKATQKFVYSLDHQGEVTVHGRKEKEEEEINSASFLASKLSQVKPATMRKLWAGFWLMIVV